MGKFMFIGSGDSRRHYNWEVSFTKESGTWESTLFETLEDARDYANDMVETYNLNQVTDFVIRRLLRVNTFEFLSPYVSENNVSIIQDHEDK